MNSRDPFRWNHIYRCLARLGTLAVAGVLGVLLLIAITPVGWADNTGRGQKIAIDLKWSLYKIIYLPNASTEYEEIFWNSEVLS